MPPTSERPRSLWNLQEAAQFLRLTERALYLWVHRQRVPVLRLGRGLRFSPTSLETWMRLKATKGGKSHV